MNGPDQSWEDNSGLIDIRALKQREDGVLEGQVVRVNPAPIVRPGESGPPPRNSAAEDLSRPRGDSRAAELYEKLRRALHPYRKALDQARQDRMLVRVSRSLVTVALLGLSLLLALEATDARPPAEAVLGAAVAGLLAAVWSAVLMTVPRFRHADVRFRRLRRLVNEIDRLRNGLIHAGPEQVQLTEQRALHALLLLEPDQLEW